MLGEGGADQPACGRRLDKACLATNRTCSLSWTRRGSGWTNWLLSTSRSWDALSGTSGAHRSIGATRPVGFSRRSVPATGGSPKQGKLGRERLPELARIGNPIFALDRLNRHEASLWLKLPKLYLPLMPSIDANLRSADARLPARNWSGFGSRRSANVSNPLSRLVRGTAAPLQPILLSWVLGPFGKGAPLAFRRRE